MTRHIRIAKGVGIVSSVCLFLASSSAAYGAQSWQDNLRSFFSLPGGARTVSGPEKLDLRSTRKMRHHQAAVQDNLTKLEWQLRTRIEDGRSQRRLSEKAANDLRSDLERVTLRQANFLRSQNGTTDEQTQQLIADLANISVHLNNALNDENVIRSSTGSRLAPDQALVQGNLTARAGRLKGLISLSERGKRLSRDQSLHLKLQLDQIAMRQSRYVVSQGGLTDEQYRQLFSELQDVDLLLKPLTTNAVPNGSRDSYGSLVDQQSALLAQIKKAEGEGRISVIQAMAFRQQVQTLSLQSVRYQAAADSWRLSGLSQKLKNVSEGLNRSIVSIPGFDY